MLGSQPATTLASVKLVRRGNKPCRLNVVVYVSRFLIVVLFYRPASGVLPHTVRLLMGASIRDIPVTDVCHRDCLSSTGKPAAFTHCEGISQCLQTLILTRRLHVERRRGSNRLARVKRLTDPLKFSRHHPNASVSHFPCVASALEVKTLGFQWSERRLPSQYGNDERWGVGAGAYKKRPARVQAS